MDIMESKDRAVMPVFVAVRVGIWLESAHITKVRVEVMLSLGLINRVQHHPNLLRDTSSMP